VGSVALFAKGHDDVARMLLAFGILLSLFFGAPFLAVYTKARGRAFRVVKWAAMAALLMVAFGPNTREWWWLMITCAWPLVWTEITRVSIRRKLPVEQWPRALYL